MGFEERPG